MCPAHRLLVDELDSCEGLGLRKSHAGQQSFLVYDASALNAARPPATYLKVEVRLLEPRAHHSLRSRLLAPGPHLFSIGCLGNFCGRLAVDLGDGRRCGRLRGDGLAGLQLMGCGRECSPGSSQSLRQLLHCPES